MEYVCYILKKSVDKDYFLTIYRILLKISDTQNWDNNDTFRVLMIPFNLFLGIFP